VTVMLPEQLRAVFNINLNWQMRKWSLSLRSRYRGLRLDDLVRPGEDRYESPFWSHSIGMNYRISPEWTVSLNASNISRNDQVAYQGSPDKILTIRPGTLTVSLSVNARFGGRPGRPRAEG
jgi:outer membrane cobalamin receptor